MWGARSIEPLRHREARSAVAIQKTTPPLRGPSLHPQGQGWIAALRSQ